MKGATATKDVRYATSWQQRKTSTWTKLALGAVLVQISKRERTHTRLEKEVRDVVQSSHVEFTRVLPRRNFGKYVEEELAQHRFAAPFVDEEWLLAIDAVVLLVELEME